MGWRLAPQGGRVLSIAWVAYLRYHGIRFGRSFLIFYWLVWVFLQVCRNALRRVYHVDLYLETRRFILLCLHMINQAYKW